PLVEYIHHDIQAKTLRSTHYHELTALEDSSPHLKNIHVMPEEHKDEVRLLHQIIEGAAHESYGIRLAKLAELPESLIERAREILTELEDGSAQQPNSHDDVGSSQLSFFEESTTPDSKAKMPQEEELVNELKRINLFN